LGMWNKVWLAWFRLCTHRQCKWGSNCRGHCSWGAISKRICAAMKQPLNTLTKISM